MPNHTLGNTYSFASLLSAYHAEAQTELEPHFLLYKGEEILALCLSHKSNPKADQVWVGTAPAAVEWGKKLAQLKDKKTLPLYYAPRNRAFFTFMGQHLITDDTAEPQELAKIKSASPLSRVVFLKQIPERPAAPGR